jgi:phosphoribosylformylglycinamidine synthase
MYKARIYVNYKPSVLDPKAEVIKNTLARTGQKNVQSVLYGKYFELELTAADKDSATQQVESICDQMLANVNMETYCFDITEEAVRA